MADRFQILALDGGGAKALFTAHLLAHLEEDLDVRVVDSFDLIAGTSAGGIIALALGAGLRPAEIVDRYEQLATTVFSPKRRRWRRGLARLTSPTYEASTLRRSVADVLGDRLLGDSHKRLIVPSWDLHRGAVHVFKTPHHDCLRRDWKVPMVDVAMATSAAPAFLPGARVDGQILVDGGLWANNPSVIAIAEALGTLNVPPQTIRVLNIGTTDEVTDLPKKLADGGFATWRWRAIQVALAAGSRGAEGTAKHLVGKGNFVRFDAQVAKGRYRLDDADAEELHGLASAQARDLSPTFAEVFADHVAAPFHPLHARALEQAHDR